MKDYKWELRKGSAKEICPACGRKRFVPYVLKADGRTIADVTKYGRCDREQNCGYSMYPGKDVTATAEPIERVAEQPLVFSPAAVMVDYNTPLFAFAEWLIGRDEAIRVWNMYKVGRDGKRTVFWQIAKDGEIRAGKSIPYKHDGHRDKGDRFPAGWCHYSRQYDGMHTGKEVHQCFFGEHLLTDTTKKVAVVESEKTAIFMASYFPWYTWLASGGSQGLSESKLQAIEGLDVTLFPDNGQFERWAFVAQKHYYKIDRYTDLHPCFEGCDLLDYFV